MVSLKEYLEFMYEEHKTNEEDSDLKRRHVDVMRGENRRNIWRSRFAGKFIEWPVRFRNAWEDQHEYNPTTIRVEIELAPGRNLYFDLIEGDAGKVMIIKKGENVTLMGILEDNYFYPRSRLSIKLSDGRVISLMTEDERIENQRKQKVEKQASDRRTRIVVIAVIFIILWVLGGGLAKLMGR